MGRSGRGRQLVNEIKVIGKEKQRSINIRKKERGMGERGEREGVRQTEKQTDSEREREREREREVRERERSERRRDIY